MKRILLTDLPTFTDKPGEVNVVIETPSGSRNKFAYNPERDVIEFSKSLPAGSMFPREFGFIPSTLGDDGDPLDVLVFMDEPMYPGILVPARLIGVIQAEQTEKGETLRNDRLIAVASSCQDYETVRALGDLEPNIVVQIEHFFISYNELAGRKFKPIGRADGEHAMKLVEEGRARAAGKRSG